MAKKISQLTQATEVKSDDVTVIVQDGETKKLPLNMMVTKQDIENKKIAGLAKLDEIEATYENDTYTPTITVKNKSSVKVGQGDEVDYSANVMDGHVKSAILKGSTKYRDIDTGEILETFEDGRNLELVSVRMPDLMTFNRENMFKYFMNKVVSTYTTYSDLKFRKNYGSVNVKHVPSPLTFGYTQLVSSVKMGKGTYKFSCKIKVQNIGDTYKVFVNKFYNTNDKVATSLIETIDYVGYVSSNIGDTFIYLYSWNEKQVEYYDIMITKLSNEDITATYVDDYKTNILSTPEDLELRGIGEVQDTLDCLTGEVAERVGEIVLNGSENWFPFDMYDVDGYSTFVAIIPTLNNYYDSRTSFISADFATGSWDSYLGNKESEIVYNHDPNKIGIRVKNEKASNAEEIKAFLSTNNIRINYKLATPVVKTVDLMPSGTHPSTTPYCWKNGHIQLSSSGLLPNLEYSVVTSRAGQINQNATMIVKNDKRIFDLEILLAGGLVNTTYQALTLQNQVETGLSKVSLSSETEPDYLLYHMIMKLIEEKAYKLDDLTEKVSVFYLYEKLSDEQFETIYSALYPFVEDEIVEEPVVEELPEVVEDEVIM